MASTYSNIKIQLMATGENSGTWGNVTNVNLGTAIEQAMVETATVTFASANVTLTLTDTNAAQNARALRLNLTGTTGGARDLIVPAIQKPYIVNNGTADTITVKVSGQTGIAVPASKTMLVYNNGTDVVDAINHLSALSLGTALPIASGGTGSNTATFSGENITSLNASNISSGTLAVAQGGTGATSLTSEAVVIGNTAGAVKFVAPGTDGNVLTSNGTAWVSEALVVPAGVPVGGMVTFAGATDTTYPGSTWLECNGQVVSQTTYSSLFSKVGLLPDGFNDASTFTTYGTITTDTFAGVQSMAYNGTDLYVAVGYRKDGGATYTNLAWTSTDAITWTVRTPGGSGDGSATQAGILSGIVYANSLWVAVGRGTDGGTNANIRTSTDGITWTTRTSGVAQNFTRITYGGPSGGRFLAARFGAINGAAVASSTDAITWTAFSTPGVIGPIVNPVNIMASDTAIVFHYNGDNGGLNYASTSTDYTNWYATVQSNGATVSGRGSLWSSAINKFLVSTASGTGGPNTWIYSSPDGYNWVSVTLGPNAPFFNFIDLPNEGVVIALGIAGNAYRNGLEAYMSSDGISWSKLSNPTLSIAGLLGTYLNTDQILAVVAGNKALLTAFVPSVGDYRSVIAADIYSYDTSTNFSVPYKSNTYGIAGTAEKTFIKATE
jgi:hypothetical protein